MNRPAPSVSVRYTLPVLFSNFTCAAPTGTLFSSTTAPAQSAESAACISTAARRLIKTNPIANTRIEAMETAPANPNIISLHPRHRKLSHAGGGSWLPLWVQNRTFRAGMVSIHLFASSPGCDVSVSARDASTTQGIEMIQTVLSCAAIFDRGERWT